MCITLVFNLFHNLLIEMVTYCLLVQDSGNEYIVGKLGDWELFIKSLADIKDSA